MIGDHRSTSDQMVPHLSRPRRISRYEDIAYHRTTSYCPANPPPPPRATPFNDVLVVARGYRNALHLPVVVSSAAVASLLGAPASIVAYHSSTGRFTAPLIPTPSASCSFTPIRPCTTTTLTQSIFCCRRSPSLALLHCPASPYRRLRLPTILYSSPYPRFRPSSISYDLPRPLSTFPHPALGVRGSSQSSHVGGLRG